MRAKVQTMSALEELDSRIGAVIEAVIRQMVEVEHKSHEKVSEELKVGSDSLERRV